MDVGACSAACLSDPGCDQDGSSVRDTVLEPVRPRGGYLELRFLDAQPADRIHDAARSLITKPAIMPNRILDGGAGYR
jgi:hypothetical protein